MAEIVLDRVSKRYGRASRLAVRDASLHIGDGEFAVIVGPSGCGKSTILRLIAGLESPTTGDIRIAGRNVNALSPRERQIAMTFQDSALYPHMTAYQNLAFALRMRKLSKGEVDRRVRETAALLGVTELLTRKPGTLSGGERQRLALGRAVILVPEANSLLFDEPLSNLDAALRITMRREIKSLHQRLNATMIHVTHDQEEAMTLGDRLIVMADGSVQQDGSPIEVYQRPNNRFVAGFIGSPAMNFVEGSIEIDDRRPVFAGTRGARIPLSIAANEVREEQVVLGVRPDDVRIAGETSSVDGTALAAVVRFIEHRGSDLVVHADARNFGAIVARARPGEEPAIGQPVCLRVNAVRIHLFRPGPFGERIALR